MKRHKKHLLKIARQANAVISGIKDSIFGGDPLVIMPYRGFASETKFFLKGRVLENENVLVHLSDNELKNLLNSFKRLKSDEAPGVQVDIQFNGQEFKLYTDEEGYFEINQDLIPPLSKSDVERWLPANITLPGLPTTTDDDIHETAEIYMPAPDADYAILTDIDDTVLETHVTSLLYLRMLYVTLFTNAHERLAMEGIEELLPALANGRSGRNNNPVFYVSDSPWNIYDVLEEFMELKKLPRGPIMLRDFGLPPLSRTAAYRGHKLETISQILEMYPGLPFIMLGDTASKDADIYLEIARLYPNRILSIYIRHTKDTANARRIAKMMEEVSHADMVLVKSSAEIFSHARAKGYLPA